MIVTPVCSLFGLRYPIFQGGMAWISDAALASAVSNAGGLGIISSMNAGPDYLRDQIAQCRAMLDDPALPFGVNIICLLYTSRCV